MPAYVPSPAPDLYAPSGADLPVVDSDQPAVGYECAMPWFQVAAPAAEPGRAPRPGSPAA